MLWIRIIFFFLGLPWNVQANRKWQFQWEGANFITKASTLHQNHSEIIEPIKTCANGHVSHRTVSFFQNQLIQLDSRLPKFHSHILIRLHWCFRSLGGSAFVQQKSKIWKHTFFFLKIERKSIPLIFSEIYIIALYCLLIVFIFSVTFTPLSWQRTNKMSHSISCFTIEKSLFLDALFCLLIFTVAVTSRDDVVLWSLWFLIDLSHRHYVICFALLCKWQKCFILTTCWTGSTGCTIELHSNMQFCEVRQLKKAVGQP